jgi:hypothetical protein
MNLLFVAVLLAAVGPAGGLQCRTIQFNKPSRIFNSPTWDNSGDRLLLVDIASGEIEAYGISGEREQSVKKPGPEELDFSTPNVIVAIPYGYVLRDGSSRFLLLDQALKPVKVHDIDGDRQVGNWRAAPFQFAPLDTGLVAYGDVRSGDGPWKTGIFRVSWDGPLKLDFLREMPGRGAREPYLLAGDYMVRLGQRAYVFSFAPAYGLIEIDKTGVRLREGLPAGFGTLPNLPESHGRTSMGIMYAAFSRSKGVVGLLVARERLYLLLRNLGPDGRREWFLAEYDPVKQQTVALLSLPTAADHVEVAAGKKWLAVIEKGPFLADERFTPGNVILVPLTRLDDLHAAGGSVQAPKLLCRP